MRAKKERMQNIQMRGWATAATDPDQDGGNYANHCKDKCGNHKTHRAFIRQRNPRTRFSFCKWKFPASSLLYDRCRRRLLQRRRNSLSVWDLSWKQGSVIPWPIRPYHVNFSFSSLGYTPKNNSKYHPKMTLHNPLDHLLLS